MVRNNRTLNHSCGLWKQFQSGECRVGCFGEQDGGETDASEGKLPLAAGWTVFRPANDPTFNPREPVKKEHHAGMWCNVDVHV